MRKRLCLLFLLLLTLSLSGCMSRQLEEQMLVIILGVDAPGENAVRVTVKVPGNAANEAKGSGGEGGEQMGYLILEAAGKTFADAMEVLSATTPRTLNFSQVREIVIGEEAAGTAFSRWIEDIYALPRMRPSAAVVVCRGEAGEFVTAQKPYVGIRLSRYIETTLSNYAGKGFVPAATLGDALRDLYGGLKDPLLICGGVNAFTSPDDPPENALDAEAGGLTRRSVNPIELFGAAAVGDGRVTGVLTGYEMALLHLLWGHEQSLSLLNEGMPVTLFPRGPAALRVDTGADPVVLDVRLTCDAHYVPGAQPDAEALRARLEQDITDVLRHLQALRCDGLGFGGLAVRRFLTVPAWENFNWREKYRHAAVRVAADIRLRGN